MKTDINKELLNSNNIVLKKKAPVVSFIIFVAAIVALALALCMEKGSDTQMPTLLISAVLFIFGVAKLINTPKTLIHTPTEEELVKQELFFETNEKNTVLNMLQNGELTKLRSIDKANNNLPLKVELYSTSSGNIALYQIFQFVPYEYRPVTEMEVYRK